MAFPTRFSLAAVCTLPLICAFLGASATQPNGTSPVRPGPNFVPPPEDPAAEPIQPIPAFDEMLDQVDFEFDSKRATLGERLYHDPRLSTDNTLSCASCHDLRYGGIDRATTATGIRGQIGPVNTPTVYNAVFGIAQFWDGRAADLVEQAGGPPLNPGEMGSSWEEIMGKVRRDKSYVTAFATCFPDKVKKSDDIAHEMVLDCIANFEVTLVTPNARFDRWLGGDGTAITPDEHAGYELFKSVGCSTCHYGVAVGGKSFQRLGAKRPFFSDTERVSHVDQGRFNVTNDERDRHVFKVPSLRNVATTGPWFHDGSQKTLEQAVHSMALHQLDVELSEPDVKKIAGFLRTLTGEWRGRPIAADATDR